VREAEEDWEQLRDRTMLRRYQKAAGQIRKKTSYRAATSPSSGVADSLDEATAAFRAAGKRPLSEEADSICST
jgi:hypothetical protein